MKKILFLIIFTFSISIFAQSSNIVVTYNFLESYDNSNTTYLSSNLKNDGKSSLFEVDDKLIQENSSTTYDKSGNPVYNIKKKSNENRSVYKDFTNNQLTTLANGYDPNKYFIINEDIPTFDWKIENETKEILGYKCQKATTNFRGRNYIAWFAPKIPVSDGPWKFEGLAGLILEVADDSGKIKIEANKIVLNAENINTSFETGKKYPKVTWEEYIQNIDKDFNNQVKAFKSKASEQGVEVELDLKFENMEYLSRKDENN